MRVVPLSLVSGACIALLLAAPPVTATPGASAFFARLMEAEQQATELQTTIRELRDQIVTFDDELDREAQKIDIARRATRSVQQKVEGRLARWESGLRSTERIGWRHAGARSDTQTLLRLSSPSALNDLNRDLEVLSTVSRQSEKQPRRLVKRALSTVLLAQNIGKKVAAEQTAEDVKSEAKRHDLSAEVRRTAKELAEQLVTLSKRSSTYDFHRHKGTLVPPVSAKPTDGFGKRGGVRQGWTRHTGLTYRVAPGTTVRTVAPGHVVFAGTFEGYGNLVIVDHGGRYHTVYGHLSEIAVRTGIRVDRRKELGKTGATGSLDGPKLFFELRHEGRPIDPIEWFRGGRSKRR